VRRTAVSRLHCFGRVHAAPARDVPHG
jgi:hypothetical protein